MRTRLFIAALFLLGAAAAPLSAQTYHVTHTYVLGGDGGWDYIALDSVGHRLFIGRQDRVMVVNPDSGTLLGEIPGLNRAHGVAFDYAAHRGFATSGADSQVTIFDLRTLAVISRTSAAIDDDGVFWDPATRRIYTMNGDAHSASVIDPASGRRVGDIPLGGKPEFGVSAGDGTFYVNLEDSAQVVEVDARAMRALRRWSLAPCGSPTGLAIDRGSHLLFSGCRSGVMAISDYQAGRLVATVPIGQGVDATRFDPATQLAFASNGEGTITVIHEDAPDRFTVVATVQTKPGARTMELDPVTHRIYTVSADFGPAPTPAPGQRRSRPPVLPGTFALIVLEP
jgi:DNA-binding beta-propeller fold protein YncE